MLLNTLFLDLPLSESVDVAMQKYVQIIFTAHMSERQDQSSWNYDHSLLGSHWRRQYW